MSKLLPHGLLAAILTATLLPSSLDAQLNDDSPNRVRIRIDLTNVGANPQAKAKARFESRQRGAITRLKFNVEGEDLSPDFTGVEVFVNGKLVHSAPVIAGRFQVDLDSFKGGTVPQILEGDFIDVIDSLAGDLLFTGVFGDGKGGGGGGGNSVDLRVQLTNFGANPLASAKAKHRTIGTRLKFNVEGEDLTSDFMIVDIFAAGSYFASELVDGAGGFSLDIDTAEGDTNVPALIEGDVVDVMDASTGELMFRGVLLLDN